MVMIRKYKENNKLVQKKKKKKCRKVKTVEISLTMKTYWIMMIVKYSTVSVNRLNHLQLCQRKVIPELTWSFKILLLIILKVTAVKS